MILVCSAVGFLGLLSAATGFAAEAKRIKVRPDLTEHLDLFLFFGRINQLHEHREKRFNY